MALEAARLVEARGYILEIGVGEWVIAARKPRGLVRKGSEAGLVVK